MILKTQASLFSGVGAIEAAIPLEILWANENDKYAQKTYRANHPGVKLYTQSIRELSNLPKVDLLSAGFPCQSFSIAGNKKGFDDERGNLFFELLRVIKEVEPKVILLENVANIVSHDDGKTIAVIREGLQDAGYFLHEAILNTSTYTHIPQNRKRWFLVGFREEREFKFPLWQSYTASPDNFFQGMVLKKYYYTDRYTLYPKLLDADMKEKRFYKWRRSGLREYKNFMCPTLTANMGTGGHNVPIIKDARGIRKLTPYECFRFQGQENIRFPEGMSDSQLYKQAGNSVTTPLIKRIWERIAYEC